VRCKKLDYAADGYDGFYQAATLNSKVPTPTPAPLSRAAVVHGTRNPLRGAGSAAADCMYGAQIVGSKPPQVVPSQLQKAAQGPARSSGGSRLPSDALHGVPATSSNSSQATGSGSHTPRQRGGLQVQMVDSNQEFLAYKRMDASKAKVEPAVWYGSKKRRAAAESADDDDNGGSVLDSLLGNKHADDDRDNVMEFFKHQKIRPKKRSKPDEQYDQYEHSPSKEHSRKRASSRAKAEATEDPPNTSREAESTDTDSSRARDAEKHSSSRTRSHADRESPDNAGGSAGLRKRKDKGRDNDIVIVIGKEKAGGGRVSADLLGPDQWRLIRLEREDDVQWLTSSVKEYTETHGKPVYVMVHVD